MKDIMDLIKKLENLIKEREEELDDNKRQQELLDHEYQILRTEKSVIDVNISSIKLKKSNIETTKRKMKEELVSTIILSIVSIVLIAFVSMISLDVIAKFSTLKSILLTSLITLGGSPLIIRNESKEYRRLKKNLGNDNLEVVSSELDEKNNELELNLNKQSLNRKKHEDFKERNIEVKNEINDFKVDLQILKDVKNMTIDQSLKSNEILKSVLNDIYNQDIGFEVDKSFQKTKK